MLHEDLYQNGTLTIKNRENDLYTAKLNVYASYVHVALDFGRLSGTIELRYEFGKIDVNWDVSNYVGRKGNVTKGNPYLKYSQNNNIDLKWKMLPTRDEFNFHYKTIYFTKTPIKQSNILRI